MQYWWVNQNQTYRHELAGGYLWSPKTKANGTRNHFYDNMTRAQPGDMVFSFCDTTIKAIGLVTAPCEPAPKPDEFGSAGAYWSDEGWLLPIEFSELERPIRPKDHIDLIEPTLPSKYSPLQSNGNGNQGVYLALVPPPMVAVLLQLIGAQLPSFENVAIAGDHEQADQLEEVRIKDDDTVPDTEKAQLIKARRGQGLFRKRVEMIEKMCRVSGVAFRPLLRASHIKPWRDSANVEKLDGHNGLLLAPHIDVLFDQGFISFSDEGQLLVSPLLPAVVLEQLGVAIDIQVGRFTAQQSAYLAYHRAHVWRQKSCD